MIFPALVTSLALLVYMVFGMVVARARGKYGVKAPATTGNLDFERRYRVQMNMLEQMVITLPSMWMFALFWLRPDIASGIGALWVLGRIGYAMGYYRDSEKRYAGFGISMLCTLALALGALAGIVMNLITMMQTHSL